MFRESQVLNYRDDSDFRCSDSADNRTWRKLLAPDSDKGLQLPVLKISLEHQARLEEDPMISHPNAAAELIEEAAQTVQGDHGVGEGDALPLTTPRA